MNFHDTKGMFDAIAKWVEECDVEIDWEAIMQCKWWVGPKDWVPPSKWSMPTPFPSRLTPPIATKLLFAQWWNGLHIRPEIGDPLDDYVAPRINEHQNVVPRNQQQRGGEGVDPRVAGDAATGPNPWKIFLQQLAAIERIEVIELKLIKSEERKALVRMAWVEEELRKREVEHNRERVRRQMRGGAVSYMSRKAIRTLIDRANKGSLESIAELERRGMDRVEIARMRELANRKSDRMREVALKRWASGGKIGKRVKGGRVEMKKEEGKVNERAEGEADTEARGTALGGAIRLEEPAGLLPVLAQAGREGSEESGGMMDEVAADNEVDLEPVKKQGIERELEVIRVGPNPRILTCRYKELASERTCRVGVKSVANFVRGMRFKMVEPMDEIEYGGVWRYEGVLPRRKGRW
jgi:hypothetical protein